MASISPHFFARLNIYDVTATRSWPNTARRAHRPERLVIFTRAIYRCKIEVAEHPAGDAVRARSVERKNVGSRIDATLAIGKETAHHRSILRSTMDLVTVAPATFFQQSP